MNERLMAGRVAPAPLQLYGSCLRDQWGLWRTLTPQARSQWFTRPENKQPRAIGPGLFPTPDALLHP
jgi:hypothetical protein